MCHLPLNVTLNTNLGTVRDKMGSFQPLEEFLQPFVLWPCCHLGTIGILVQIILRGWGCCPVCCWVAALPPASQMSVVHTHTHTQSCDNPKCSHTLPVVLWGAKLPLIENHCFFVLLLIISFYWSIVDLQHWVSFRRTAKWEPLL